MGDFKSKQRLYRAIHRAAKKIDNPRGTYNIIFPRNSPFHIEAVRNTKEPKELRKIRIALDVISEKDELCMRSFNLPMQIFTKEIWCDIKGQKDFDVKEIF